MNANHGGYGPPSHGPGPQMAQAVPTGDDGNKKLLIIAAVAVVMIVSLCCVTGIGIAIYTSTSSDDEINAAVVTTGPATPTTQTAAAPATPTQGIDSAGHATPASFGVQQTLTVDQLARNVVGVTARMVNAELERGLVQAATSHFSRRGSRRYFAAVILSSDWRISRSRVGIIRNRNLDVMLFWQDDGGVCRVAPYAFKQDSDGRGFQSTFRYADGRSYEVANPVPERGVRPGNPQKTRRRNDFRLSSRQPAIYAECSAPGAIDRYEAERARKIEERRARRRR